MQNNKEKYFLAEKIIKTGFIYVNFRPSTQGVKIPSYLLQQQSVCLQFGYDLAIPIIDLELDLNGIRGTLSFNHHGYFCDVPWEAVTSIITEQGKGKIWSDADLEQDDIEQDNKSDVQVKNSIKSATLSSFKNKIKTKLPPYLRIIK